MWVGADIARCIGLAVDILVYDLPNQTQYAAHHVPHDQLARLCSYKASTNLPYALNELHGIASFELAHYAVEKGDSSYGAWSRVAYLASLEEAATSQRGVTNIRL